MPAATVADTTSDGPLVKRQKVVVDDGLKHRQRRQSPIFTPFRTIGLVSPTSVPFTSVPLGKTTFQITTSVGRSLQTYDLKRGLHLVFLTRPQTPYEITASLAWKEKVFAAWGGGQAGSAGVWVFARGKKIAEFDMPADMVQPIKQILVFGSWVVGCCDTRIEVWKSASFEHYTTLLPTATTNGGNELSGGICNMPTYLNKIFAGRKDGGVEIWNVSTAKLVYTILPPSADCGAVTALQPTPALSIIALAYSKGPLVIHDIRTDRTVLQLGAHVAKSTITSISFRTDDLGAGEDGKKAGVMASAGPDSGDVTFWDLNDGGRVMGVLRGAHNPPLNPGAGVSGGGINNIEFLAGQPVIVTSGLDNSLKTWIFDETPYSPIPRILHSRSGHAATVTRLQFLPSDSDGADAGGKWLLSTGRDRSLWGWSLRRDAQSSELSQGNIRKKAKKLGILAGGLLVNETGPTIEDLKAPAITCIASALIRDGGMGAHAGNGAVWQKGNHTSQKQTDATLSGVTGWESIVTGHEGDKYARTWFWGRKRAGRWAFETGDGANVSSVAISPCGTFALVGSERGSIDMFNLQSGQHRRRFPAKLTPAQAARLKNRLAVEAATPVTSGVTRRVFHAGLGKHTKAVTGIVVDSLNKTIISCSLDGKVKFWEFGTGKLVDEIDWHRSAITAARYHAASDLVAMTCDDMSIRVVDIETKRTIRELWGCEGVINDLTFSNDGRWVIAASGDRILRVWDLPTGHLIDAIRFSKPCTALAFSNTGEFLATACEGSIGVNLWNNKSLFTHVPTKHISSNDIVDVDAPTASGEGGNATLEGAFEEDVEENDVDTGPSMLLDQLSKDMVTLSLVPKSRWQTLLYLDLIKERNKPTEAPKAPEKAPFFLPSIENAKAVAISEPLPSDEITPAEKSRIMKMDRQASEGAFTVTLRSGTESGDYSAFIDHLKTLSPSSADLEIRSLQPSSLTLQNELVGFVRALTAQLAKKRDYELVQAWMNVFLKLHGDSVVLDDGEFGGLKHALTKWRETQEVEANRIGDLVGWCGGVVTFLRSPRV